MSDSIGKAASRRASEGQTKWVGAQPQAKDLDVKNPSLKRRSVEIGARTPIQGSIKKDRSSVDVRLRERRVQSDPETYTHSKKEPTLNKVLGAGITTVNAVSSAREVLGSVVSGSAFRGAKKDKPIDHSEVWKDIERESHGVGADKLRSLSQQYLGNNRNSATGRNDVMGALYLIYAIKKEGGQPTAEEKTVLKKLLTDLGLHPQKFKDEYMQEYPNFSSNKDLAKFDTDMVLLRREISLILNPPAA